MEAAKQAEEDFLAEAAARGDLRSGMDFNSKYMVHMKALDAGMDAFGIKTGEKVEHLEAQIKDKEADGELVGAMSIKEMDKGKPAVEE